jgi:hypothetical protein
MGRISTLTSITTVFLSVLGTICAQSWLPPQIIGSSDQQAGDNLGISVAISDSFMVAGAWWEEGENGSNNPVNSSGAVYIYRLQPDGQWAEVQKLISPNRESLGYFGFYVAIEEEHVLIGAFNEDHSGAGNAGRVYAYHLNGAGLWVLDDALMISNPGNNDYFGRNLAMAGGYALIGTNNDDTDAAGENFMEDAGAAYLFKRQPDHTWQQIRKLVAFDREVGDNFGKYVDMDRLGLVIGAFKKDQGFETLDGGAAYGAYCNDSLLIWGYDNVTSADLKKILPADRNNFEVFGWDVAISGKWAVIGKSGETDQPGGGFGSNTGAAYFFHWENGNWVQKQKVYAPDFSQGAFFGRAIGIDNRVCVIGAGSERRDGNGQNPVTGAGAAYVFELQENNQWVAVQKLAGEARHVNDLFAEDAVDVYGTHVAIGAWLADDINGTELLDGGVVYIFERDAPLTSAQHVVARSDILLMGNPSADGLLHLRNISNEQLQPASVRVYSMEGYLVAQEENVHAMEWQIDLSHLATAMYVVHVRREGYIPLVMRWVRM